MLFTESKITVYSQYRSRLFMVGTIIAGQFAIYGDIKKAIGAEGGVEIAK